LLPSPGDTLPDFELFRADGSTLRLSEVVTRKTLLIFLRHLA
jgi:peroxiredoxin